MRFRVQGYVQQIVFSGRVWNFRAKGLGCAVRSPSWGSAGSGTMGFGLLEE